MRVLFCRAFTHHIIHAVGYSSMVTFDIPIAQFCTNQYKSDINFYLMKLNSNCILGNPFLTIAEPHGITSVRGIKGLYLTVEQEHKSMFLPLISKRRISMVHSVRTDRMVKRLLQNEIAAKRKLDPGN